MAKFNFNKVIKLYLEGNREEGIIYMNEHIGVFIRKLRSFSIPYNIFQDVVQESILTADEAIRKSIDRGIKEPPRIYTYVSIRVIGRIKNFLAKNSKIFGEENNDLNDFIEEEVDTSKEDWELEKYCLSTPMIDILSQLPKDVKQIFIMRQTQNMTWKDISEYMGLGYWETIDKGKLAQEIIDDYIENNEIDMKTIHLSI